jgi:hypothetical protein
MLLPKRIYPMAKPTIDLTVTQDSDTVYQVAAGHRRLGQVESKWFAHVRQEAWEATGVDGHRSVHQHRWQAVWAVGCWDGTGYPFPVSAKRRNDASVLAGL